MSKGCAIATRAGSAFRAICCPSLAEGAWLQQKGRPPSLDVLDNWSSRLPGTHPLKSFSWTHSPLRLERLPNSGGISPLKSLL